MYDTEVNIIVWVRLNIDTKPFLTAEGIFIKYFLFASCELSV